MGLRRAFLEGSFLLVCQKEEGMVFIDRIVSFFLSPNTSNLRFVVTGRKCGSFVGSSGWEP